VSDQDFFFDEEEEEAKPAKSSTKPVGKPAAKAAGKPAAAAQARRAPAARETAASGGSFFEQSVTMTIASLMTVIGLLIGVIIGFVAAPKGTTTAGGSTATTGTGTTVAPAISDEQMSSGVLPEGHPDISSMGGVVPTGTVEATSAP
jgi:hypothetical protein